MPASCRPLVAILLSIGFAHAAFAQSDTYRVGVEGKKWFVSITLPGFEVHQDGNRPDGRRYFYAANPETGVNFSLTLEDAKQPATTESCRRNFGKILSENPMPITDTETSESADYVFAAYTVTEFRGQKVNQRFFRACRPHQDVYLDFNISKANFQKGEESLLAEILKNSRIEQATGKEQPSTSWDYWKEGGLHFRARDYRAAIGPYEKALQAEQQKRRLRREYWYVLIDNLGMAHGINGNLARAKEIFEYGIQQDPKYPLFYYNLACTYGEMNDMKNAMEQLTLAYKFKENVIRGESIPDPRTDSSFQRFMKSKEFKEFLEQLPR